MIGAVASGPQWSTDDDGRLRAMYPDSSAKNMARELGRSVSSVRSRCWTLGLASKAKEHHWSCSEVEAMRAAYADRSGPVELAALAKSLGRSSANVCRKAMALGLTNKKRCKDEPKPPPIKRTADELHALRSQSAKDRLRVNGHPRGMLGKQHKPEVIEAISKRSKAAWADPSSKHNTAEATQRRSDLMTTRNLAGGLTAEQSYSRCKHGRREDIGDWFFRSGWEANYARHLNTLVTSGAIARWDYECKVFEFANIRRGTRTYKPDFMVVATDGSVEWHEVKGWMDDKSRLRLNRMRIHHPKEVVLVIGETWFKQAEKSGLADSIHGWERKTKKTTKGAAKQYAVRVGIEPAVASAVAVDVGCS